MFNKSEPQKDQGFISTLKSLDDYIAKLNQIAKSAINNHKNNIITFENTQALLLNILKVKSRVIVLKYMLTYMANNYKKGEDHYKDAVRGYASENILRNNIIKLIQKNYSIDSENISFERLLTDGIGIGNDNTAIEALNQVLTNVNSVLENIFNAKELEDLKDYYIFNKNLYLGLVIAFFTIFIVGLGVTFSFNSLPAIVSGFIIALVGFSTALNSSLAYLKYSSMQSNVETFFSPSSRDYSQNQREREVDNWQVDESLTTSLLTISASE